MVQLDPPKKMSHQSPANLIWTLQAVPQEALLMGLQKKVSICISFEGATTAACGFETTTKQICTCLKPRYSR
jgi:hypothetical protein